MHSEIFSSIISKNGICFKICDKYNIYIRLLIKKKYYNIIN